MRAMQLWMRIVGVFYLVIFVAATFVKLPIKVFVSQEALAAVPPSDEVFRLLEDAFVMFGLELGVIGLALILASRVPHRARILVWTVLGIELVRGIIDDIYMLTRGYEPTGLIVWIVIHSVIIATGLYALSVSKPETERAQAGLSATARQA